MKHLLIIGARGWGREVYNMLPLCIGYRTKYNVKGFLDDNNDVLNGKVGYPPIIDSVENYAPQQEDVFICALGDIHWKKHYVGIILSKGGKFISLIHKTAQMGKNTTIGQGCIVSEHVAISCDITIGNFVTFQPYVSVNHDVNIGNYCHLGTRAFMGGNSVLGTDTTLLTNSIIMPRVEVGIGCTVGAGCVVNRNIQDGMTVIGNPAEDSY